MSTTENFLVEEEYNNENHIPYEVDDGQGNAEDFLVQQSSED